MGWDFLGLSKEWRQSITSIHGTTSFIILNTSTCKHSYSTIHQLRLENIDCTQIKYLILEIFILVLGLGLWKGKGTGKVTFCWYCCVAVKQTRSWSAKLQFQPHERPRSYWVTFSQNKKHPVNTTPHTNSDNTNQTNLKNPFFDICFSLKIQIRLL